MGQLWKKIEEYLKTGELKYLTQLRKRCPLPASTAADPWYWGKDDPDYLSASGDNQSARSRGCSKKEIITGTAGDRC